ncbi:MAG TPA: hypothetical protein VGG36_01915 [Rhizomicrobium sp.]
MIDWRRVDWGRALAAALLVGFLWFVVVEPALLASACTAYGSEGHQAAQDCSHPKEPSIISLWSGFWDWTTRDAISFYTFVLAIFTVALFGASVWQGSAILRAERLNLAALRTAQRQSRASLRAAKAAEAAVRQSDVRSRFELRPYLTVDRSSVLDIGGMPKVSLRFRNFGKTPAYEVHRKMRTYFAAPPHNFVRDCGFGEAGIIREPVIEPGRRLQMEFSFWEPISPEIQTSLQAGDTEMVVYCEIRYKDTFGDWHVTRYTGILGRREYAGGILRFAEEWNDAT